MYRCNCSCLIGNRRFNQTLIHIHCIRSDVHKHGNRTAQHKSIGSGYKGVGRHNNLITLLNISKERSHLCSMGTGGGQKTFCRPCPFFYPLITLPGIGTISANLLILYTFFDIISRFFCIWRHIKLNHLLSPLSFPASHNISLHIVSHITDNIFGSSFYFFINTRDIVTDYSEAQHDKATDNQY